MSFLKKRINLENSNGIYFEEKEKMDCRP